MVDVKNVMKERKLYLEMIIKEFEQKLRKAPEGTLRISHTAGRTQYFHRKKTSDRKGTYLKKKEYPLVTKLAQKDYDLKIYKAAKDELRAIQACLNLYPAIYPEQIYGHISESRQNLIQPLIETDDMYIQSWSGTEYKGKEFMDGIPELLTDHGERVRSKSELIIANMLFKENIPYRYEYPVKLKGVGIVYPDFTVLNVRLRKEIIWEHQGMMDNSEYAEKAVRKVITYNMNGYFCGDNLILTSETKNNPIHIRQIKEIINHYLI